MTTPTKGHTMKTRLLAIGALAATTALSACGQDDAAPAPTSSTPDQHIHGGNDPRYKQGVDSWLAFSKLIPGDGRHMPASASKYATQAMINYQNKSQDDWFGGKTELGKVTKTELRTTAQKYQGIDIYLDTPTQPYEMTVRVCGTTQGTVSTSAGKKNVSSTAPATLHFKSPDKGKNWKIDQVDVNAPSNVKLECDSPASPSASATHSPSKG